MFANRSGASPTINTAGHTGIPVGTLATMPAFAAGAGVESIVVATTGTTAGAIVPLPKKRLASIEMTAIAPIPAANTTKARNEARTGFASSKSPYDGGPISARRALSRFMNSADGSIVGKLRTSIKLLRIAVSCREHFGQRVR